MISTTRANAEPAPGAPPSDAAGTIYRASPDILACPFADGLALFDMRANVYFSLNRSGAIVWDRARDGACARDLHAAVAGAFGKPESEVRGDVDQAIVAMVDARLLTTRLPDGPPALLHAGAPCRNDIAPTA